AAKLSSKISGIGMEVTTNQPAVVVYTPLKFPAICFETQNFPDAPNHEHFPSCVLRPGETYENESRFKFDLI
ncbi:MAG: aldose epimerase family protein, partial [Aurantibacter sp.]